jgi:hypothetical protein
VKSVERIVGANATGETCHIIIEHGGKMPFWEGQSYGVIPPGTKVNSKGKEVPHGVRLYSIASTRYGDEFDGRGRLQASAQLFHLFLLGCFYLLLQPKQSLKQC